MEGKGAGTATVRRPVVFCREKKKEKEKRLKRSKEKYKKKVR